ncbi:hypothetical protein ISF_01727 [Cordyceps fumosorosea ARSEF 2679]|uniref:Ankyrin 2,3/unc44 n=1 Tax=Cordyceps fumosorosea (strain ARSEF 2679) TaxID=1081104 RepID=A0A168CB47_CORFA|nr:hypothetical protein ISF_01727 [Cordyceps fumosorosea ARSEF 2679]OAA71176.1 hypothetical protein ISF_01727 [Cordyceps fumosorosea ARSEF 2679]
MEANNARHTQLPNATPLETVHSGSKTDNSPSAAENSLEAGSPVSEVDDSILKLDNAISPEALLAASEHEVVDFLAKCHVQGRHFDISSIVGLKELSVEKKNMIADKINAATPKVHPLKADDLNSLLGKLEQQYEKEQQHVLEPTESPGSGSSHPEVVAMELEAEARASLLQAGGMPALQINDIGFPGDMTREHRRRAAMWLEMPKKGHLAYNEVLPVFSTQLEHWKAFQQYWQWGNRGEAGREKGLSLFLASMMRENSGFRGDDLDAESAAWYNKVHRERWQRDQPRYTASHTNTETLASYAEAMENRLKSHNFTRPYRLLEDPREQDTWTTAIEYLNFNYWEAERDTARMKAAEPKYRRAMDSLLDYTGYAVAWFERDAAKALPTQLQEAEDAWRALYDKIKSFREGARAYLVHEANLRRDQRRSEWVLEELASIEKGVGPSEKDELVSIEKGVASSEKEKVTSIKKGRATSSTKEGLDSIDKGAAVSSKEEPASLEKGAAASIKEEQDREGPCPANAEDEHQESTHASTIATNSGKVKGARGNSKQQLNKRKRNEGAAGSGKDSAQDTEVAAVPPARVSRAHSSRSSAPSTKAPAAEATSEPTTATSAAAAPKRTLRGRRQSPDRGDDDAQAGAADGAGTESTTRSAQKGKQSKRPKTVR